MREVSLYAPMVRGAATEGWSLFHPQEGAAKAPFDLCGITSTVCPFNPFSGSQEYVESICIAVGAEVKLVKMQPRQDRPLPWSLFKTHQRTWLEAYAGAGGMALAILYAEGISACDCVAYVLRQPADFDLPVGKLPKVQLTRTKNPDVITGWSALIPLWANQGPI